MSGGGDDGDAGERGRKTELRGVRSSALGVRSVLGRLGRLSPVDAQGTSSVIASVRLTPEEIRELGDRAPDFRYTI